MKRWHQVSWPMIARAVRTGWEWQWCCEIDNAVLVSPRGNVWEVHQRGRAFVMQPRTHHETNASLVAGQKNRPAQLEIAYEKAA